MYLETEPFKENRRNTLLRCGMVTHPFMKQDQCQHLAVAIVTDDGWDAYTKYRIKFTRYHKVFINKLPILSKPLICQKHITMLLTMPNNPRESAWRRQA